MKKEKFNKLIFGLAGIGVLAGLCYLRRKDIMHKAVPGHGPLVGSEAGDRAANAVIEHIKKKERAQMPLSEREKKELQDRIKAMTMYELEIALEAIPVELCMKRIQNELNRAREFESMIKKAYEMK